MTDVTLVRKRTVYDLDAIEVNVEHPEDERAVFSVDEDELAADRTIVMSINDYNDMGKPHQITVTIEPGNRLT